MKNIFWASLHLVPGIGSETLRKLCNYFGEGKLAWEASVSQLEESKCLNKKTLSELIEFRQSFCLEKLEQQLKKYSVSICIEKDELYPNLLKKIFSPPFIFYYQGSLKPTDLCIGIVGSRIPTLYGEQIAKSIAGDLAREGFTVVSGAAKGIDTKAHIGALKEGYTIAVLGCGLDIAYPAENAQLLANISKRGAVISEYPLGTKPLAGHFPARNRIISGLSKGILVVEATSKSGSLITAEMALSEGRDVFAVPGSIYSLKSQGTHKLIKQGAKLTSSVEDILEEYDLLTVKRHDIKSNSTEHKLKQTTKQRQAEQNNLSQQISLDNSDLEFKLSMMSKEEQAVYNFLSADIKEGKSTDEIIYKLRENVSNIAFILLQMKLKGFITELSPNFYIRAN